MSDNGKPLKFLGIVDDHALHKLILTRLPVDPSSGFDEIDELELTPQLVNHMGGLQGGLMATAVDIACGHAVRKATKEKYSYSTTHLSGDYLRPMQKGPIQIRVKVRRVGRTNVVLQADVVDAEGTLGALFNATFMLFENDKYGLLPIEGESKD